jgi:hypothetical protein
VRDFQESFGWLICIFDQTYGEYLIQESSFQKSCYDCFFVSEKSYDPEGFYTKQVNSCLAAGDLATARSITNHYASGGWGEVLREKIALAYLARDDFDQALIVSDQIFAHKQRDALQVKIAVACLDAGDPTKAAQIADGLVGGNYINELWEKIASTYLRMNRIDSALDAISKISGDKSKIQTKAVKELLDLRNRTKAVQVINSIISNEVLQHQLLVKVALYDYMAQNDDAAQVIVARILTAVFKGYYLNSIISNILYRYPDKVTELFARIARDCCQELRVAFALQDESAILERIYSMAKSGSTFDAFHDIEPKAQPEPESKGSGYNDFKFDDHFNNFFRGFSFGFGFNFGGFSSAPQDSSSQERDSTPAERDSVSIAAQYKILGLPDTATKGQIIKRFRELALENHPDRVPEGERAAADERMKTYTTAYRALGAHLDFK